MTAQRRDVHDPAPPTGRHRAHRDVGELHDRRDVEGEDLAVGLEVAVRERAAGTETGAVDQQVDRLRRIAESSRHTLEICAVGQIGRHRLDLDAVRGAE